MPAGLQDERLRAKLGEHLLAEAAEQRRVDFVRDRAIRLVDRGGRLLERHAGLQAREQVRPIALAIRVLRERSRAVTPLERDRQEKLRLENDRRARETARSKADDRQRLAVHDEVAADNCGITGEAGLPIAIAQDDGGGLAVYTIVVRVEQPADERLEPQHRKILTRDEQARAGDGFAINREVRLDVAV